MPGEVPKRGMFECNVFIGGQENSEKVSDVLNNNSSNFTSHTGTPMNRSNHYMGFSNIGGTMGMQQNNQNLGFHSHNHSNDIQSVGTRSFASKPPLTGKSQDRGRSG
jgi:hypothetical protein